MICACNQGRNPPCTCAECADDDQPTPFDEVYHMLVDLGLTVIGTCLFGYAAAAAVYFYRYYF